VWAADGLLATASFGISLTSTAFADDINSLRDLRRKQRKILI
jgi:hypothetical protein